MKLTSVLFIMYFFTGAVQEKNSCTLTVIVDNLRKAEGSVHIAVYNTKDNFLEKEFKIASGAVTSTEGVQIDIDHLPYGTYALSIFHDVNDNGEMDKNFIGIPKEPFGFSNDAMGAFGPPGFEKASIHVNSEQQSTRIRLKHF